MKLLAGYILAIEAEYSDKHLINVGNSDNLWIRFEFVSSLMYKISTIENQMFSASKLFENLFKIIHLAKISRNSSEQTILEHNWQIGIIIR